MSTEQRTGEPSRAANRKIINYYIYYVASQTAFDRGIFVLFLMSKGLWGAQIGWLQAALFWSTVAFEVPTGIIGDKYGRKLSVAIGLLLFIFYCGNVILWSGFIPFLVLYCIYGLAKSFISGSDRALLYDYLKANGREGDFLRIDSRSKALGTLSLACAIVIGGYLQLVSWSLVYIAYGSSFLISLLAWSRMQDVMPTREVKDSIILQIRQFFSQPHGRRLAWIIVASALVVGAITPYYIISQALFKGYGLVPHQIGTIVAAAEFLAALGFLCAERVSKQVSLERIFYVAAVLSASMLMLNQLVNVHLAVVIFLVIIFISPLFDVLIGNYLISQVPGPIRASAMSMVSFVESAVVSVGYLAYGYALEFFDIHLFIAASALLPCTAAWCAYVYFRKRREYLGEPA